VTSPSESITKEQQEQRIAESVEDRLSLQSIVDSGQWYDFDRVSFADSVTGLKVADLRRVLASVPSQVEAAVKAEREECLNAALDVLDSKTMRYEYCVNAGDAVTAAIRSRGERSL
jgi:hypothetical protein